MKSGEKTISRRCRTAAFSPSFLDIDYCDARPQILFQEIKKYPPVSEYPMIKRYCENYKDWRVALMDYMGISDEESKEELIKLFYAGSVCATQP